MATALVTFAATGCTRPLTRGSPSTPTTASTATPATASTATPATGEAPIVVAAAGDLVCPPGRATTPWSCRHGSVSDRLVADDAVTWFLALGDLQYDRGDLASFQTAYGPSYGRLKARTRPAPGNHEYATPGAAGYYAYFGEQAGDPRAGYYAFDAGRSWRIVALNSNCWVVSCNVGSAQEQWLRATLAADPRPCTLAYWHHPRFSSGPHGDNVAVAALWDALEASGAEIVLAGHDHGYERFAPQTGARAPDPDGIREFVVGTGGASHYERGAPRPNSEVRATVFGYLRLTLATSGYSWQLVGEDGDVLDEGSGACH